MDLPLGLKLAEVFGTPFGNGAAADSAEGYGCGILLGWFHGFIILRSLVVVNGHAPKLKAGFEWNHVHGWSEKLR